MQTLRRRVYSHVDWVVLPDGDQQDHQQREDHLHVGQRIHPERTQDDQLDHLQRCEVVDLPLRHAADVVGGRVGGLDGERQDGVKRLVFSGTLCFANCIPKDNV